MAAMPKRRLMCYAEGADGDWEAICVDLDIAVQGQSLEEVSELLSGAILLHIQSALKEDEVSAARLLNRKAPFWLRLKLSASFLAHLLSGRRYDDDYRAGFDLPCPA